MSSEASLFGDDEPPAPPAEQSVPVPIAEWQVDLLRKALDGRGLATMAERQQAIEEAAGRSVASLRALTGEEAMLVLGRLGASRPSGGTASAWDERDEDTWIDRL